MYKASFNKKNKFISYKRFTMKTSTKVEFLDHKPSPITSTTDELLKIKLMLKKYMIITVIGLLLILFVVIVLNLKFSIEPKPTIETTTHNESELPHSVDKLRLITRDEWIAQLPEKNLTNLILPINRVIITHTATEGCDTQAQCVYRVRNIQTFHMESRGWDDIAYNFLVGGDGAVYEGRGWDKRGVHTKGYNDGSIGIALIGTFTKHSPPQRQFNALRLILEEGVLSEKLTEDYKMYPHRAFFGTESPGEKVIDIIKTWPHYIGSIE